MLFLGFSAGLPILLIFSSLSLWLREAGVDRSVVTFFSWAALGYSFKFVWAPLVDVLPFPILTKLLGRRRSWILFSQLMVITAIMIMASIDPASSKSQLGYLALSATLLGFSSATQDIVIDAYRIESAKVELQALMSSTYIAGYRIGMLVAGAGALYLATYFGSEADGYSYLAWRNAYLVMALAMLVGVITVLVISEPDSRKSDEKLSIRENFQMIILFVCCVLAFIITYWVTGIPGRGAKELLTGNGFNSGFSGFVVELIKLLFAVVIAWVIAVFLSSTGLIKMDIAKKLYLNPVKDFFHRYGMHTAILLLGLIGLYRISDIVLGVISNVFYQDIGYTKIEIANVSKSFGLLVTIVGGFLGGILALRFGVMRILLLGAILAAATNLLFMLLAKSGYSIAMLYVVIGADNLSAGIASAAFVAFLSALTNIKFTAMQFAIFTSLMTLIPKVLGGYSGSMVNQIGYSNFFLFTAVLGMPVIVLILILSRKANIS